MKIPIDGAFVREIGQAYQEVRERRVTDYLSVAATDGMGDLTLGYLDAAMALAPREFEIVLREKMRHAGATLADRGRAACLYLRGHERKLWYVKRPTLVEARNLARTVVEEPMNNTKADLTHEPGANRTDEKDALMLLVQVATEGELLARALDHGSPAEKLDAIERWFSIFPTFPADMIQHVKSRLTPN